MLSSGPKHVLESSVQPMFCWRRWNGPRALLLFGGAASAKLESMQAIVVRVRMKFILLLLGDCVVGGLRKV